MNVTYQKVAKGAKKAGKKAVKGDPIVGFQILDTQDDLITINGTNAAGDVLDISGVATLTASSSDPTLASVDTPSGMTVTMHALKVGSVTLTFVATWNDGSVGPFTVDFPISITTGGPTGLIVTPGTPTVRP